MSRTRTPGDGPKCWCGADATFSGYCNAHYNTDTGRKIGPPLAAPAHGLRALPMTVLGRALPRENGAPIDQFALVTELQAWRFLHFTLGMHVTHDAPPGMPPTSFRIHANGTGAYAVHFVTDDLGASFVRAVIHHAQLAGMPFP